MAGNIKEADQKIDKIGAKEIKGRIKEDITRLQIQNQAEIRIGHRDLAKDQDEIVARVLPAHQVLQIEPF